MFRHHHVPEQQELVFGSYFTQCFHEQISSPNSSQKWPSLIAAERDEVQISAAVVAFRFDSHRSSRAHPFSEERVGHPHFSTFRLPQQVVSSRNEKTSSPIFGESNWPPALWEIVNDFRAVQFWWLSHELLRLEIELSEPANEPGGRVLWLADLNARMVYTWNQCESIGLKRTDISMVPHCNISAELQRLEFDLARSIDVASVKREIKALRKNIELELAKYKFTFVAEDKTKYFERNKLFGDEVHDKFPSTRFDLKEAGNSLACGLNTSAGFHLMRAAEIGLWELGRDRQIPSVNKIEFTDWGDIIRELETEIKKIQQWPNSRTKEDAHKFYNRALVDIRAFNDGWRRHLAHVRQSQIPLDDTEAIALAGHVERFLKTLATKIAEGQYTAIEWT
jgi:hypothetical protein